MSRLFSFLPRVRSLTFFKVFTSTLMTFESKLILQILGQNVTKFKNKLEKPNGGSGKTLFLKAAAAKASEGTW